MFQLSLVHTQGCSFDHNDRLYSKQELLLQPVFFISKGNSFKYLFIIKRYNVNKTYDEIEI